MFEDTKGVIRSCKSKKDRQHNGQKFEDTKGVIRSCKSKKDRQYNGQQFEDTKGVIRSVNQRRIDNTMVDRKMTKGQTMMYKTLHRKLNIEQH